METQIRKIAQWGQSFLHLLYPNACAACGTTLKQQEEIICLHCELGLPQTNSHEQPQNVIYQKFAGKIPLENVAALYTFGKSSGVQQLIHHLKYSSYPEIGIFVGRLYGRKLRQSHFAQADAILPVPLHPHKQQQRGYNQSEMFGLGLSEELGIPLNTTMLLRRYESETQTRKSRIDRWTNTKSIFALDNPDCLQDKHVIIVDDVITTGSTIEGCAAPILAQTNAKISVLGIAALVQ